MKVKSVSLKFRFSKSFSFLCCITVIILALTYATKAASTKKRPSPYNKAKRNISSFNFNSLRLAITDLIETFGPEYPKGKHYLTRLDGLEKSSKSILNSLNQEDKLVRAEVIKYDDLVALGSEHACKEHGKLHVEGKNYLVQEADILHIRFNV